MMLNTRAMMTTQPTTLKNPAIRPVLSTRGRNAAMVVSTPKMTGIETSQVPSMAACTGGLPICSWPYTRSPTTMASSTRMPRTRMKAMTVMALMEMSAKGNMATVPSSAIGIPAATHMASLNFRNMARMMTTRPRPESAMPFSVSRRAFSCSDSSFQTFTNSPAGSVFS